jgi:ribosomal-protein-alanine N-acetyltransferase
MNEQTTIVTMDPQAILRPAHPIPVLPRHIPLPTSLASSVSSKVRPTYSIRAHLSTDVPQLVNGLNDRRVAQWMTNRIASPYTEQLGRGFLDYLNEGEKTGKGRWDFAIVEHAPEEAEGGEGRLVGGIGLKLNDPGEVHGRTVELGYWLAVDRWGRGIVSAVVPRFVEWAWEALPGMNRMEAQVYGGNERSAGVLVRTGFELEGKLRGKVWKDGEVKDLWVYGLVRA